MTPEEIRQHATVMRNEHYPLTGDLLDLLSDVVEAAREEMSGHDHLHGKPCLLWLCKNLADLEAFKI